MSGPRSRQGQIAELLRAGQTVGQVAGALGLSVGYVYRIAREGGIAICAQRVFYRHDAAVLACVNGWRSVPEIADRLGIDRQIVRRVVGRHGVAHRVRRGGLPPVEAVLNLSPEVCTWLGAQVPEGGVLEDVVRAILVDCYLDEGGAARAAPEQPRMCGHARRQ